MHGRIWDIMKGTGLLKQKLPFMREHDWSKFPLQSTLTVWCRQPLSLGVMTCKLTAQNVNKLSQFYLPQVAFLEKLEMVDFWKQMLKKKTSHKKIRNFSQSRRDANQNVERTWSNIGYSCCWIGETSTNFNIIITLNLSVLKEKTI